MFILDAIMRYGFNHHLYRATGEINNYQQETAGLCKFAGVKA